ncbi:MAG: NFACT family protein [Candidatus Woesearchaeota archaeon]
MKKNLSAIELKQIVAELQELLGSKVSKIYQPIKEEVYIQAHSASQGKKILRIFVPRFMHLTEHKLASPQSPHGFCQSLRKWISNTRIAKIKQTRMERIVEITFESNAGNYILIIELFARGNIILCREDMTIISALETQKFKDREIRPKAIYTAPKAAFDLTKFKIDDIKEALEKTKSDNIVKFLAIDLGLGGLYAEEIIENCNINKNKTSLEPKEMEQVYKGILKLLERKPEPMIVTKEGFSDVVPFELAAYRDYEKKGFKSFNEALDEYNYSNLTEQKSKEASPERERLEKILRAQEEVIKQGEAEIAENQRKGEMIYEHYQEIKDILERVNSELKKLTKEEIIEKHKIKELDLKDKTITVEL